MTIDVDRINELARKARTEGLTDEEKAEQAALRRAYIDSVKDNPARNWRARMCRKRTAAW